MNAREFYNKVDEHPDLEWVGCRSTEEDAEVHVRHKPAGAICALPVSAVQDHPWEDLRDVLTGVRAGRILTHITRIVGYFSHVHNWNKSKLAELHDRDRGDYNLPEER